jgi:hypothetical protein
LSISLHLLGIVGHRNSSIRAFGRGSLIPSVGDGRSVRAEPSKRERLAMGEAEIGPQRVTSGGLGSGAQWARAEIFVRARHV